MRSMGSGSEPTSRRGPRSAPLCSAERRSRSNASRCAATSRPDTSARVIATAGHVDHGKSTLIKALTGIDPDRLREERERGMTIDLGFAWLTLGGGGAVGIVDVPGHQDFIRNMLAGVGPVDAVLLVVALDEGVMPQTREHLAILGVLGVDGGVVALTKRDLVDDEWASLARADVSATLQGTRLASAPMIEVSATAKTGLVELVDALDRVLATAPARRDLGRPRLGIDRAFTLTGFGTVVTGTLVDGSFATGDEIEVLPTGQRARIRGIQTHKRALDVASPVSRVAVAVLERRSAPTAASRLLAALDVPRTLVEAGARGGLDSSERDAAARELVESGRAVALADALLARDSFEALATRVERTLAAT